MNLARDKDEATRLADALRRCADIDFDGDFGAAAALLRRWPDGTPVAYQYLFDGPYGEVWRNSSEYWNGLKPKASRPLYAAPPDESKRIAALEAERAEMASDLIRGNSAMRETERVIDHLNAKIALQGAALETRDKALKVAHEALEQLQHARTGKSMKMADAALRAIEEASC